MKDKENLNQFDHQILLVVAVLNKTGSEVLVVLDLVDRHLLNELQKGIPLQTNPFENIARQLKK